MSEDYAEKKFPSATPENTANGNQKIEALIAMIKSRRTPQQAALDLVVERRNRQDAKWGRVDNAWELWNSILGEEFGEVCRAYLEGSRENWKQELIDVAAVAVAALEFIVEHERAEEHMSKILAEKAQTNDA